jgi:hypothetical protein
VNIAIKIYARPAREGEIECIFVCRCSYQRQRSDGYQEIYCAIDSLYSPVVGENSRNVLVALLARLEAEDADRLRLLVPSFLTASPV